MSVKRPVGLRTVAVLQEVSDERSRQLDKWGPQYHPDGTGSLADKYKRAVYTEINDRRAVSESAQWREVLLEEVYEALSETDPEKLATELTQVAAVAVAWVEDIRARG